MQRVQKASRTPIILIGSFHEIIRDKMEKNARKYPVERGKGFSTTAQ